MNEQFSFDMFGINPENNLICKSTLWKMHTWSPTVHDLIYKSAFPFFFLFVVLPNWYTYLQTELQFPLTVTKQEVYGFIHR